MVFLSFYLSVSRSIYPSVCLSVCLHPARVKLLRIQENYLKSQCAVINKSAGSRPAKKTGKGGGRHEGGGGRFKGGGGGRLGGCNLVQYVLLSNSLGTAYVVRVCKAK